MAASFLTQWRLKFRDFRADLVLESGWFKIAAIILAVYLLLVTAIGIYWSCVPQSFSVTDNVALKLNSQHQSVTGAVIDNCGGEINNPM